MKQLNKCEICNNKEFNFLFKGGDKLLGIPGRFSLYECENCGLYFLNPQPKNLNKYYPKNYYSLKNIDTTSKKIKLKLLLYKTYYSEEGNIFMKILLSPFKFLIIATIIKSNIKLLDIGCGSGQFLYEMKKLGLDVYGVEPNDFNKEEAEKYKLWIANTDLISAKYQKKSFDLITLNNVLEHINNPNEILDEINRILKNDGKLIIDIPNTKSLANWVFGKNWLELDIPRHLFNFNLSNIKLLLKNHGFKVTKVRYNSRPSQFAVSLYFLFGRRLTGIPNRIIEVIFIPLTWFVNLFKIGDAIEVQCIKR